MALDPISKSLLGLAKGLAEKWAVRRLDESIGRGPNALSYLSGDVEKLTEEVYRYSATIQTAVTQATMQRTTAAEAAAGCTFNYRLDEISAAQEVAGHLQTIRDRVASVATGAASRAQSDSGDAGKEAQNSTSLMVFAERQGNKDAVRHYYYDVHRALSAQAFANTNLLIIQRRSTDLTHTLDSLIAEVNSDVTLLQQNSDLWLQARIACGAWLVRVN